MGHSVVVIHHTDAYHHGQRVTVFGVPSAGLLAVTRYGTRRQQLLGLITVHPRPAGPIYRLFGQEPNLTGLEEAAQLLSQRRNGG
jgi:hypothetical protein